MHSISVRRLDKNTYEGLRRRATKHGVSMEEEARRILSQSVAAPERISMVFRQYFGTKNGVDLTIQHEPHEPINFDAEK